MWGGSQRRAQRAVWLRGASTTAAPWLRRVLGSLSGHMQARLPAEHIYCRLAQLRRPARVFAALA